MILVEIIDNNDIENILDEEFFDGQNHSAALKILKKWNDRFGSKTIADLLFPALLFPNTATVQGFGLVLVPTWKRLHP